MIHVAVFTNDGTHSVSWSQVVGTLCVVEAEYVKRIPDGGDTPSPGATHEEMIDRGWKSNHPYNWFPEVFPVVVGGNAEDEYPLRVLHPREECSNQVYSTILVCSWPPEEDRGRAIRAGLELVRHQGSRMNWADLPAESSPDPDAPIQ
jgi:hypothetical protein